jgi:hypothetical protein
MYPHERSLVKQLANQPFALIGVNSDDDVEQLRETIKEKNITWRSFQNQEGSEGVISENWAIQGWPTIFILDAEGVIRWTGHGGDINAEITKLLAEMGHEVVLVDEAEEAENGDAGDGAAEDSGDGNAKTGDGAGGGR